MVQESSDAGKIESWFIRMLAIETKLSIQSYCFTYCLNLNGFVSTPALFMLRQKSLAFDAGEIALLH